MVYRSRRARSVSWGAWLLAGIVGSFVPIMPAAFNFRVPLIFALGLDDAFGLGSVAIAATFLAFLQYIILSALIGKVSAAALMWIPVSAAAARIPFLAINLWQTTVPRTLISVSAIQASLPPGFPLLQIIFALFGIANAAVLGLAQGILLARIFGGRSIVALWLGANLLASVLVGIVFGIRLQEPVTGDDATLTAIFVSNTLIDAALYAAVTGAALVAIAGQRVSMHARAGA